MRHAHLYMNIMVLIFKSIYKQYMFLNMHSHLYIQITQQKVAWERGHVASISSHDRAHCCRIGQADGHDHASSSHFANKNPQILERKNLQSGLLSKVILWKKITNFLEINLQSNFSSSEKITKKTLSFYKINPPSWSSLRTSFRKILRF